MTHREGPLPALGRTILLLAALGCSAPAPLAGQAASEEPGDQEMLTRIGSLTVGSDGAQATYQDLRSTCSAFRLTMALTMSAGDVSQCLDESDLRRIAIDLEDGRVVSSRLTPNDSKAMCVAAALGNGKLKGLSCMLEADVSR